MTKRKITKIMRVGIPFLVAVVLIFFGREDLLEIGSEPNKNAGEQVVLGEQARVAEVGRATSSGQLEEVLVKRVVDGDTIELSDGRKLRYIGVDTPETKDPRRPVGCFGQEASDFNRQLVEGKTVWLEKDVSETDKYNRLLRYVYILDGGEESGKLKMVQEVLLTEGYAQVYRYPPDVKYIENFKLLEKNAREQEKGLWSPQNCPSAATTTSN